MDNEKIIFKVKGTIKEMGKITNGVDKNDKDYQKQEFVIDTIEKFPAEIAFTAMNAQIDKLSYFRIGGEIEVQFRIFSNESKGRKYTNLKVVGFS